MALATIGFRVYAFDGLGYQGKDIVYSSSLKEFGPLGLFLYEGF